MQEQSKKSIVVTQKMQTILFTYNTSLFIIPHRRFNVNDFAKELSPFIKHLHINDNDLEDDLHLAVGDGKIDWNIFKNHFDEDLKNAKSILIETSDISSQRKSAEYLRTLGILK